VLPLCFCAFLAFGVVLVLIGANQASLAAELDLDLARSGLLASSLALGLGAGVVIAGPLFDRFARRPLFVGSALLAAVALLGVEREMSYVRWLAHAALIGAGIGLYDTLINAVVVQRYRERAARPMLAVHSAATIGAMLGPLLVGWIAASHHFTASFHAAGLAHVAIAAWAACVPLPAPEPRDATRTGGVLRRLALAPLVPLAAVAFAYVGVEASVTVFAVPYASEALAMPAERGQLAISAFWLGLLTGRLALLAARTALGARVLIAAGAGAAVLIVAAAGVPRAPLELALFAVGAALGCVYPLMIALAGQTSPSASGTAAGLAAGAGALGGFAVPWLTGAAGDAAGIALGFGSLAFWCAAIALAAAASRRVG
jgi:DHA1 family bicyclomycin/chloramphenicol resistance-like MFS transporter